MSDRPVPGTFCWFECATSDADKARDFYTDLLGWEVKEVPMPEDMEGSYTVFEIEGNSVAGLFEITGEEVKTVPPHWATYVATDDVDALTEKAKSLDAKAIHEPMDLAGVGKMSVVQDPTGAGISLFQAGEHKGSPYFGDRPNTFCWSELVTREMERAEKFYSELFPWVMKPAQAPGVKYTEFQVEGRPIGGIMEMTHQHMDLPPHWLPYVRIEDCDAAADRIQELGGQLIVHPQNIPNTGRFCVFQDPAGAVLAVIRLEIV